MVLLDCDLRFMSPKLHRLCLADQSGDNSAINASRDNSLTVKVVGRLMTVDYPHRPQSLSSLCLVEFVSVFRR